MGGFRWVSAYNMYNNDWENIIKTLPFDLRAEVLSRMLIETEQLEAEAVTIHAIGINARLGQRDIVSYQTNEATEKEHIISVSREGLFDILPEKLFIRTDGIYENEIKKAAHFYEQAQEARRFLSPFDGLLAYLRTKIEINENKYQENRPDFIHRIWLDNERQNQDIQYNKFFDRLLLILPFANQIIGNWELTAKCFSDILQTPVSIETVPSLSMPIAAKHGSTLDYFVLGFDTVLGKNMDIEEDILKIKIHDIALENLSVFLEDGAIYRFLQEELIETFIPLGIDYSLDFEIKQTDTTQLFNLNQYGEKAVLGYSTLLEDF